MRIGNIEIEGRAALAPMAGVTDTAYRQVCREMGAAYTVTEMISAKAVEYNDRKTCSLADLSRDYGPVFLQLFGSDPETFGLAVERLLPRRPTGFDINMGCPVPKIVGNGAGSALMKDPKLCGAIVAAVKAKTDLPVTVKLRAGWDRAHQNAVETAKYCEDAGAAAVCVHGRTREQMYQGKADWEIIHRVKEALSVPVIGNGDVTGAQSACLLLEQTGCDMVLVGRGALGNPWVFREINAYLTDSCRILPPPGIAQRVVVIRKHIGLLCEYKGEERGMREARKHVGWYIHGVKGAAEFRRRAGELCSLRDLDLLLRDLYAENCMEEGEKSYDLQNV